jgi:hypothetical protein
LDEKNSHFPKKTKISDNLPETNKRCGRQKTAENDIFYRLCFEINKANLREYG